jgi:two-component system sensor histidine kinase DesK
MAAFAFLYLIAMWMAVSAAPRELRGAELAPLVTLFALGLPLVLVFGGQWWGLLVYCGVATGWSLRLREIVPVLLALGTFIVVAGTHIGQSWSAVAFGSFLTVSLGFTMFGFRSLVRLVIELRAAREEIARLAVSEERLRLARDLHDLLGHSLSVIALKAQVARRTMHGDSTTASAAVDDVERVARESLREVREMVSGLRQRSLAEEMQSAGEILQAAGIALDVEGDPTVVEPGDDSVLAWTVREGVTNVIRHSQAQRCVIRLSRDHGGVTELEVSDDGTGSNPAPGSGLRGLRERATAVGGQLDAGPLTGGGFRLRVRVPGAP